MYQINPKVLKTPVEDGKILLLEPKTGMYYELDETSCHIFQLLSQGETSESIVQKLVENYDVSNHQAEEDYQLFLQQLIEKNIVFEG
ncbi:MAG: PqqD family protein [Gammaproteobacteria bacterium]|jgi:5'(3')-deoxyribonucleotidase|nr:PqqD family protein [Xanthomonadales bacterium]MCB1595631.1 PqqD family protein [Xanthomonadales bacterium]MCB1603728.1 PqqD family protein [Xanthomonadales bacterium]